jgi:ferredoxin
MCEPNLDSSTEAVHEVRIEPSGLRFTADGTQALVLAAQAAGIRLPSSCRNGTCRTCMCRLVAGRIVYRIEWPGLSAEEKQEGWILPCVAYACSDLCIDAPAASALSL